MNLTLTLAYSKPETVLHDCIKLYSHNSMQCRMMSASVRIEFSYRQAYSSRVNILVTCLRRLDILVLSL